MNKHVSGLLCCLALSILSATGCQSTVGGQTMPSAYYIDDDVQYFPAGPENKLSNLTQRLEEYKLQREQFEEGINDAAF